MHLVHQFKTPCETNQEKPGQMYKNICFHNLGKMLPVWDYQVWHFYFVPQNIIDEQFLLKRMADVAINLFAMTSVLSRATRSLKTAISAAEHEALLTTTFCREAYDDNKKLLQEVSRGKENIWIVCMWNCKNFGKTCKNMIAFNLFTYKLHMGFCSSASLL